MGVDAKGNALVSWTEGGTRKTVLVPPRGQLFHGGSLSGRDVSRPTRVRGLPSVVTVRRTPDGRLWALQRWRKRPGAPVELHLARWTGAPTKLSLAFDGTRLTGRVTFHGKPVTGVSPTLEGKRVRVYVFLDCLKCAAGGKGWGRMLGVASKRDGSFSVLVRSSWRGKRYRATVLGPNLGTTLAPNALATAR